MISIITPIYQAEKYLETLINSIINQTYHDWELLLIDDGSTDGSAEICDRYAQKDNRIRVFHKANGGIASARNQAMDMATGEYLAFADSDDWVEPYWLERLYKTAKEQEADIVVSDYYEEYPQKTIMRSKDDDSIIVLNRKDALLLTFQNKIASYLWSMLIRRDIAQERFAPFRAFEDYATLFAWMLHVNRVVLLHTPLYHYRQYAYSCLHSNMKQNLTDYIEATITRYELVKESSFLQDNISQFNAAYIYSLVKGLKDIVRSPYDNDFKQKLLKKVSAEIQTIKLPSPYKMLGFKYYVRYRLLCKNLNLFKRIVGGMAIFSFHRSRKKVDLFS